MKRRTEHLVEKRDGRREFLRATKLARSVHLALFEIGVDEDWRALELAGVVLEGLREKRAKGAAASAAVPSGAVVLTTAEIADAVQHLLVVTGQPAAAVSYGAVQAERARRRETVASVAAIAPNPNPNPKIRAAARASNPRISSEPANGSLSFRRNKQWPGEG